jgi:(p)ppGpp synthase/HD superfamily hydrolase
MAMQSIDSQARSFAMTAHGDQMYGDQPYVYHLDQVAQLVAAFGADTMAIAYLHDTAEDTDASLEDIQKTFGQRIAACVHLLTDEPGANRKERKAKTYAKLAKVNGPLETALIVKTADRLANVRACLAGRKQDLWEMYREEHPVFRSSAYRQGLCESLWTELDSLLTPDAWPGTP